MSAPKPVPGWPANDEPASFEELTRGIVSAIRFAYTLKRRNQGKSVPLKGPDAPDTAGTPSGSYTLTAESLAFSLEDQGRDALTEIVGVAVRLGIEQGRRIERGEVRQDVEMLDMVTARFKRRFP